ncbi:sigma-70 family RNA polymerase sigma factor [Microbispora corallina]|uniref:RNA polymerase sigma factor n=1 Tax=Microbispora corallina TaxID=83302 RepID=A0ABQ4G498_9ACTN|nr:sigma-70 family RNA polymerase sigma factor [Microbispora corallina]GIH41896.1 RNA polymerase sigma factor [Microbispora corallina]
MDIDDRRGRVRMAGEDGRRGDAEQGLAEAARAGDEAAFATLTERYRREIQLHCYRMLGSLEDAEDLVQETLLRAWRGRATFEGRSTFRAWLYRIATNACLDALERRPRRVLPHHLRPPSDPSQPLPPRTDVPWLQPYPDLLLEGIAAGGDSPDGAVVARETVELAFLAALQHLPPRQRAVLVLRDVLGHPAGETAALLEASVAAVNSALQRARATLKEHLPQRRLDWAPTSGPTQGEREVLRRLMAAYERADAAAVAGLLAEDARATMPPYPMWFQGRDPIVRALAESFDPASPNYQGRFRMVAVGANLQPAVAAYVRRPSDEGYPAFGVSVLRIEAGLVVEFTAFGPELFPAFGLPPELDR